MRPHPCQAWIDRISAEWADAFAAWWMTQDFGAARGQECPHSPAPAEGPGHSDPGP